MPGVAAPPRAPRSGAVAAGTAGTAGSCAEATRAIAAIETIQNGATRLRQTECITENINDLGNFWNVNEYSWRAKRRKFVRGNLVYRVGKGNNPGIERQSEM